MDNPNQNPNPFSDQTVADEWIRCVETVRGEVRDAYIYPALRAWQATYSPMLILEIGSGQGVCSSQLGPCRYVGVEPSLPLLRRARDIYREPHKTFLRGDAYRLPLAPNTVDGAFSNGVWMHLDKLDRAAGELARVLKPGGRFIIFTFNPASFEHWEQLHGGAEKVEDYIEGSFQLPGFVLPRHRMYLYSSAELLASFEDAGLELFEVDTFGDFSAEGESESETAKGFIRVEGFKPDA